jgi:hypothetical protein
MLTHGLRLEMFWLSARSLCTTPLHHRLVRATEPAALLHRDAVDRLADGGLDDTDAQRLQLAVKLTGVATSAATATEQWVLREQLCASRCAVAGDGERTRRGAAMHFP